MKYPLILAVAIIVFACNKKSEPIDPISSQDRAKAAALTEFLQQDKFRLAAYYSETPIDYIDTDQVVTLETQLWKYVSFWLKDDEYTFDASGEVFVDQKDNRIENDSTPVLTRDYSVQADVEGVRFKFLGNEYQDLNYRLVSFSDTHIVVSANWNGNKVISEYRTVP